MLPGKTYTLDDIVQLAISHARLIAAPFVLVTTAAIAVAWFLPNKYLSETVIMVLPQQIPESYVKTTVTTRLEDRLATLEEQIMSRSRLEQIIQELNLYPALRQRLPMETVIERMRGDITVKVEGKDSSFRLSYVNRNALTAQKTAQRLASLFIQENLRDREHQADATNAFLDSQLQDARRRLTEQEKKLEEYQRRFSGELPSQATSNMQAVQSLQLQLQTLGEATDRTRERRLLFERQLADLQLPDPTALLPPTPGSDDPPAGSSTAQQLAAARARLRTLQGRYTPEHPDVRAAARAIRELEAKLRAEMTASGGGDPVTSLMTPAEALKEKRRRDLKAELDVVDRELADKQLQERRLRSQLAGYEARLNAIPSRESDMVELTRDYTTLKATYENLLAKREESKLAANVERRKIGEQFKVLDAARLPERPYSPNRILIGCGGAAAGLLIGVLLVAFIEYRDASFKSEEDVIRICQLPVLAVVPDLESGPEQREGRSRIGRLVRG